MKIIIKNRKSTPAYPLTGIKYEFLIRTRGYLSYNIYYYIRNIENRIVLNEKNDILLRLTKEENEQEIFNKEDE